MSATRLRRPPSKLPTFSGSWTVGSNDATGLRADPKDLHLIHDIVARLLKGDRRALARLLTLLERSSEDLQTLVGAVHTHTGHAYSIGFTGPPGAGKSTLVDSFVQVLRGKGKTVGILAVDPSSPFTGGAVLGDRIRMQRHYLDDSVFIRSLATRGSHGGLSTVASAAIRLLDAFGFDYVLTETVGVGQTELDIVKVADTVVVTTVPEAGDTVQSIKAGLMEIGDIFVVNKSDREGSRRLAATISASLRLGPAEESWRVPVLLTQADEGKGVDRLHQTVLEHRKVLEETSRLEARRRERQVQEFGMLITNAVRVRVDELLGRDGHISEIAERVESGELDPYTAARDAMAELPFFERE